MTQQFIVYCPKCGSDEAASITEVNVKKGDYDVIYVKVSVSPVKHMCPDPLNDKQTRDRDPFDHAEDF